MKKFTALSLALLLALSLCTPILARYEGCMYCESRLRTEIRSTVEAVPCQVVSGEWDLCTYTYKEEYCIKNDHWNSSILISQVLECGHSN